MLRAPQAEKALGAWGGVDEPGPPVWVPQGITHHGPREDVAAGYLAWLFDSRGTLRLTPVGQAAADLLEPLPVRPPSRQPPRGVRLSARPSRRGKAVNSC